MIHYWINVSLNNTRRCRNHFVLNQLKRSGSPRRPKLTFISQRFCNPRWVKAWASTELMLSCSPSGCWRSVWNQGRAGRDWTEGRRWSPRTSRTLWGSWTCCKFFRLRFSMCSVFCVWINIMSTIQVHGNSDALIAFMFSFRVPQVFLDLKVPVVLRDLL